MLDVKDKCEYRSHKEVIPPMGIREERRAERQNAVLETATSLVRDAGFQAVTMSAIAERMDASVGGLYRYFPTKEAIFVALQIQAIEAFTACLERQLGSETANESRFSVMAQIVAAFDAWSLFRQESPIQYQLLDQFVTSPDRALDGEGLAEVNEKLGPILSRLAQLFSRASEIGVLSPGDAVARTHLMWAAVHGLEHFRKRDRDQPQSLHVDTLRPMMIKSLLFGWGATKGLLESVLMQASNEP